MRQSMGNASAGACEMMVGPKIRLGGTEPAVNGGARAALTSCAVALCLTGWMAASDPAMAQTAGACPQASSWGDPPLLPVDVCGIGEIGSADFYAFSWKIFKFLVWPASSGQRGSPDTTRKITDTTGPRTFETLKADWETFLPDAAQPPPWNDYSSVAAPCKNHPEIKPGALVLAAFSEFGNLTEDEPSLSNLLVAQNRTYVRYQAAYNEQVYEKIRANRLYNAATVGAIPVPGSDMPVQDSAIQSEGALTVKSAWIELPSGKQAVPTQIDPSRFYVRDDAWLQEPKTGECRKATVGLVGLHIVNKTLSRPQWIWSTFEHVDNVPEPSGGASGGSYTFHNGDFGTHMTDHPEDDFRIPKPATAPGPGVPPRAYQVERLQKIEPAAKQANLAQKEELGRLGSVWQYYKLVMTQWPGTPFAPKQNAFNAAPKPPCGQRGDTATVNTTMETFFQTQQQHCPLALTCMGCHDMARKTDFIWSIPFNPNHPSAMRRSESRADAIKVLQDLLQGAQSK
jgi:hypothetical protein